MFIKPAHGARCTKSLGQVVTWYNLPSFLGLLFVNQLTNQAQHKRKCAVLTDTIEKRVLEREYEEKTNKQQQKERRKELQIQK